MNAPGMALALLGGLSALAYFRLSDARPNWRRSVIKTLPLACLALAAIIAGAPAWLSGALLLSALGDFALSRPGQQAFLYGLASFALAHVLFALLFLSLSGQPLWAAFVTAPGPALAFVVLALSCELWLAPHTGVLRWPVRAYIVLIGAMMLAALTLPASYRLATLGAVAFVLSDLVLAVQRFRLAPDSSLRRPVGWLLWALYICGQGAILWGVMAA